MKYKILLTFMGVLLSIYTLMYGEDLNGYGIAVILLYLGYKEEN